MGEDLFLELLDSANVIVEAGFNDFFDMAIDLGKTFDHVCAQCGQVVFGGHLRFNRGEAGIHGLQHVAKSYVIVFFHMQVIIYLNVEKREYGSVGNQPTSWLERS